MYSLPAKERHTPFFRYVPAQIGIAFLVTMLFFLRKMEVRIRYLTFRFYSVERYLLLERKYSRCLRQDVALNYSVVRGKVRLARQPLPSITIQDFSMRSILPSVETVSDRSLLTTLELWLKGA